MTIPRYILLFIWLCASNSLAAQQPQLSLRHYTTDHGLPSPEVYEALQDSRGYLWFATDNGLSRFNGYEFRNYSAVDGLTDPVVFHLQEDHVGRIWIGTMSGQVFYYEPQQDAIYAFWGNQEIKRLQGKFSTRSVTLHADSCNIIHIALNGYGILKFMPDSSVHIFQPSKSSAYIYETNEKVLSIPVIYPANSPEEKNYLQNWSLKDSVPLIWYDKNGKSREMIMKGKNPIIEIFPFNAREILVEIYGYLHYFQDKELVWTIPFTDDFISFYQNAQKELLFGLDRGKGIRKYANVEAIRQQRYETLLPGYSVSHILQDKEGSYWFTTLQAGVFYCPEPEWKLYDERSGLANGYVTSVTLQNEQEWYLSLHNGKVYYQNTKTPVLEDLHMETDYCPEVLYDAAHQRLWAGGTRLFYREANQWKNRTDVNPFTGKPSFPAAYYLWKDEKEDAIWGAGYNAFYKIKSDASTELYSGFANISLVRTLAVVKNKDGKVWIGRLDGLHEFRETEQKLYPPEVKHPAFQLRIEALAGLPDTTLVIGTKGAGILLYKGKNIKQITAKDGLTSDMIETLHVDARGNIWAGTLNGLNRITRNGNSFSIEHFTTAHGFPSNEINKIATRNGKVWVATMRGLVVFRDDYQRNPFSPMPILEAFRVNEKAIADWENLRLRYFENNLRIQFVSLQFRNAGKIQYRYRLVPTAAWTYTHEHQLNFASLQSNSYTFEVQAQNEDGMWSASYILPFEIRSAWWRTGWFFMGLGLIGIFAVYWYYKSSIRAIRRKAAVAAQITDLERKALTAQMNPHFFFNCLNSIQLLIHEKEENQALQYLARFAKLVRLLLEFSGKGKVTIMEEVQALENYLELEKLRFKEKLRYEIQVANDIDQFEIEIPPLLVQPFVENAIKHGIANLESGGKIKITFRLDNDTLSVGVQDNGKGFDTNGEAASRHRSMGIELTRRRLVLANERTQAADLVIQSNENQSGTLVTLQIQIQSCV